MLRTPYPMLLAPPAPIPFEAASTALVLVDPQHFMTSRDAGLGRAAIERGIVAEFEEYYAQVDVALANMRRLVEGCRARKVPVIYSLLTAHSDGDGQISRQLRTSALPIPITADPASEIRPEVAPMAEEEIIPRGGYSPFYRTPLQSLLTSAGVRTVILAGMPANVSVALAAREAVDRDLEVIVAHDASASETLEWHSVTMQGLSSAMVRVHWTHEILELLDGSRT